MYCSFKWKVEGRYDLPSILSSIASSGNVGDGSSLDNFRALNNFGIVPCWGRHCGNKMGKKRHNGRKDGELHLVEAEMNVEGSFLTTHIKIKSLELHFIGILSTGAEAAIALMPTARNDRRRKFHYGRL